MYDNFFFSKNNLKVEIYTLYSKNYHLFTQPTQTEMLINLLKLTKPISA